MKLFQPIRLGTLELKNRIVMAPRATHYADETGAVTDRLIPGLKGLVDLIALGRAPLADPEFPRKTREGRWKDIRPCIGCLQGCRDHLYQGLPITCLVNPRGGNGQPESPPAQPGGERS